MDNEPKKRFKKFLQHVLPAYFLYFLIAPVMLARLFGEVNYGPNLPYLVSLAAIGLPFLACLVHLLGKADVYRTEFMATGGNIKEANPLILWSMLIPIIMLFITRISFMVFKA